MYDKEQLMISAKDDKVLIRLHEDRGIEIFSDSEVKIKADENIKIGAEEIDMKAADEVTMKCKSSSIKMNGTTHIRGHCESEVLSVIDIGNSKNKKITGYSKK